MTKCAKCRRPTEWLLEPKTKKVICKLCSAQAPSSMKIYRCKHRFVDSQNVFSKTCNRGCGLTMKINEAEQAMINNMQTQKLNAENEALNLFN